MGITTQPGKNSPRLLVTSGLKSVAKLNKPLIPESLKAYYRAYRLEYPLRMRGEIIVYGSPDQFPNYQHYRPVLPSPDTKRIHQKVSLVVTTNERIPQVIQWFAALLNQKRRPDEIIVANVGSNNTASETILNLSSTYPIPIKLLQTATNNLAQARNTAIHSAEQALIACTDIECNPHELWLDYLLMPLETDDSIQISAGDYRVAGSGKITDLTAHSFGMNIDRTEPNGFPTPSSRSLAFRKSFWEQAGGYPEWIETAEGIDTIFIYQAMSQIARWAYVPEARVSWQPPATTTRLLQRYFRLSQNNGLLGITVAFHWWRTTEFILRNLGRATVLLAFLLLAFFLGTWSLLLIGPFLAISLSRAIIHNSRACKEIGIKYYPLLLLNEILNDLQVMGFARGVAKRPQLEKHILDYYRQQLNQIIADQPGRKDILVHAPTLDWGFMFQRPQQIARVFARYNYLVFFCTDNLLRDGIYGFRCIEPGLYLCHVPLETFRMLEKPFVELGSAWCIDKLPYFDQPRIIYDHCDDLQVSGARPEDHEALLHQANTILVTSRLLMKAVQVVRPDALLVPNGVDYELIQQLRPTPAQPLPPDLEPIAQKGRPLIGYVGALAKWFDYELLTYLAIQRPDYDFVLIGVNYDGSLTESKVLELSNVYWLGLKSYPALFEYVWRFDVTIIPFQINEITLATSPVKMFEYMACQKPVVSTDLPECRQTPGLFIANTFEHFAQLIDTAMEKRFSPEYLATIDEVARENTWDSRVQQIDQHLKQIAASNNKPNGT